MQPIVQTPQETAAIPQDRNALTEEILMLLGNLIKNCRQHFRRSGDLEFLDLTMSQLRAVLFLEEGPVPMSKLAEALGTSLPSATGIIDRLVERGLVGRREDPEDRRLVICSLSPQGEGVIASLYQADKVDTEALLASLSAEELHVVRQAFVLLSKAAVQLDGAPEPN